MVEHFFSTFLLVWGGRCWARHEFCDAVFERQRQNLAVTQPQEAFRRYLSAQDPVQTDKPGLPDDPLCSKVEAIVFLN
jgi:hypothetical protein